MIIITVIERLGRMSHCSLGRMAASAEVAKSIGHDFEENLASMRHQIGSCNDTHGQTLLV